MSGRLLDLDAWPRRPHFELFRGYAQPFFNVCAEVRVTATRAWCRDHGASPSLANWFACQQVINALEPFRYRLRGERVWVHDRIRVATTILDDDETFRFCYIPYAEDFPTFCEGARACFTPSNEVMDGRPEDDALIHGSTLPWVRFTSVTHALRGGSDDSTPKIVLGRFTEERGEVWMPVSVAAHHALMDGLHVSRFFEAFEQALAAPDETFAAG